MADAISRGTGPPAGAGSGGNFADRGGGPKISVGDGGWRRDDTQSSDGCASGCGVCGGGTFYFYRWRAGCGYRGGGADDCGDCLGRGRRTFGAKARDDYAAGGAAGYFGRPRGGEFVFYIFCGGGIGFFVAADFIFCTRDAD